MIVNRWGKYRALADFADVKSGEIIDVTGVVCGSKEVMWACRSRISDWHNWELPVEPVENQPHFDVRTQRVPFSKVKRQMREENLRELLPGVRQGNSDSLLGIQMIRDRAVAGDVEATQQLSALLNVLLADSRLPTADGHPKCLTCPYASGWDSVGTAYCSQPLGIASLFDEATRFPVTDEQYCSHHPQAKKE